MKTEQDNKLVSNIHTFRMNKNSYIGSELGGCKIESVLGVGGNGIVFLAHDESLDRQVAIKLFPFGLGAEKSKTTRFIREAKAIAKIDHPNIVQIHSVGQDEEACYIVMQYIKGKTLDEFLKEHKQLSLLDSLYIAMQIAHALEAVHHINMIHRDIKPSNVIIEDNGRVRVMDFGLVRNISEDATMITQEGVYQGTPAYSSPEQCETTNIDTRSDLYSLGVILYEMLAGKVPHEGETPLATLKKIVSEEPPPIEDLNPDVPESIVAILEKILQKDPEDRYSSATELLNDLENAIEEVKQDPAHCSKAILRHSTTFKTAKFSNSNVALMPKIFKWVALLVILTWVSFGVMYLFKGSEEKESAIGKVKNDKLTVAIYDFGNPTGDSNLNWLELGIPDMLMSSLAQYKNLNIINRSQILWDSKDKKKKFDQSFREKLIPLGTKVVIQGKIYQVNKDVRIYVTVYDFSKNIALGSINEKGSVQNIFSIIDNLTTKLNGFLAKQGFIVLDNNETDTTDKVKENRVASIQSCEQIIQQKLSIDFPYETTRTVRVSGKAGFGGAVKKNGLGNLGKRKQSPDIMTDYMPENSLDEGLLDTEAAEKEIDEDSQKVSNSPIIDGKLIAKDGKEYKVKKGSNEKPVEKAERENNLPINSTEFSGKTQKKAAEKLAGEIDENTFTSNEGPADKKKVLTKKREESKTAPPNVDAQFKYETNKAARQNLPSEEKRLKELDSVTIMTQVATPVNPRESIKTETRGSFQNLTQVLPYYYQGIQFLEKMDFTKEKFDKECKNLKYVLSKYQNNHLLKKSYKEWVKGLTEEK